MKNFIYLLFASTLIVMVSCSGGGEATSTAESEAAPDNTPLGQASVQDDVSDPNILQIAIGSPDHTTLVAAEQAAQIEHI